VSVEIKLVILPEANFLRLSLVSRKDLRKTAAICATEGKSIWKTTMSMPRSSRIETFMVKGAWRKTSTSYKKSGSVILKPFTSESVLEKVEQVVHLLPIDRITS
jgi:hypothetical protein